MRARSSLGLFFSVGAIALACGQTSSGDPPPAPENGGEAGSMGGRGSGNGGTAGTRSGKGGQGGGSGAPGAAGHQDVDGGASGEDSGSGGSSASGGSGPTCGDAAVDDSERCDDSNTTANDGCSATCRIESGWECDSSEPSHCDEICGDGLLVGSEALAGGCDDDNTLTGDGCSPTCEVEAGSFCTGEPSQCASTCGNGMLDGAEECDDMNSASGDGCLSCTEELGFTCAGEPSACVNVDDCSSNPCQNGAVCTDAANSFTCNCGGTGYSGTTCQTDLDECATGMDNCGANATCTNSPGSFACACESGYEGDGVTCAVSRPSCSQMTGTECQGESCCETLPIPTQTFTLGLHGGVGTSTATVTGFTLDKYEVTVGRFQRFMAAFDAWRGAGNPAAGAGAHPLVASSGWQSGWTLAASASELSTAVSCDAYQTWTGSDSALPMNCVDWYEAFAFCAWDGQRLPTEAEFEDAASGGDEGRAYPWGSTPVPDNVDGSRAVYNCLGDGSPSCGVTDILSVGAKPLGAGRWGHLDLGGSMWEWVLDRSDSYPTICNDCANVVGSFNLLRGGSWGSTASQLIIGYRNGDYPSDHNGVIGFRCARTAP